MKTSSFPNFSHKVPSTYQNLVSSRCDMKTTDSVYANKRKIDRTFILPLIKRIFQITSELLTGANSKSEKLSKMNEILAL